MPIKTNFNVAPYYDDYSDSKNFHRVLFKPGFAVQARELTQLQTLLQKQVERFGSHVFTNGSKVFGAEITLDTKVKSLKLESELGTNTIDGNNFIGKVITGGTSGAKGQVLKAEPLSATEQPTLVFQQISNVAFQDGETVSSIETVPYQANTVSAAGVSGITGAQANSSMATISPGCFYIEGFFALNTEQTIVLEKYSNTPTKKVGLVFTENIISTSTDTSLLDNAQGTSNFAAPGADRFNLDLTLVAKDLDITTTTLSGEVTTLNDDPIERFAGERFIELLRVSNGVKENDDKYPIYADIEKVLARRTFDESGNYTVRPFNIQMLDHVDANTELLSAGLDPGKAYVKGFEFETLATKYLDVKKGRDTASESGFVISADYGNFLYVNNLKGTFDTSSHEIVDLHCCPAANINALASSVQSEEKYLQTKVGTCLLYTSPSPRD